MLQFPAEYLYHHNLTYESTDLDFIQVQEKMFVGKTNVLKIKQ